MEHGLLSVTILQAVQSFMWISGYFMGNSHKDQPFGCTHRLADVFLVYGSIANRNLYHRCII